MENNYELVEELCQKWGTQIEKAFIRAVTHYYTLHSEELPAIRPATKASLINDYIYQYIQEEFEHNSPFVFIDKARGRFIGYDSKILIRVKKLSAARKPSVNKTLSANHFNTQTDMDMLEGGRVSNVYLGYVLNKESGNVDKVAFAYPNKSGGIAWTINVERQSIQKTLDIDIVSYSRKASRFTLKVPKRKESQV